MELEHTGVKLKRGQEPIFAVVDDKLELELINASVTFMERELYVAGRAHLSAFVKLKTEREKVVPGEILLPSLRFVLNRCDLQHEVLEREIIREIGAHRQEC